ncbi:MAG: phosphoribosyl-AMP cyclohydrolase [Hyphomicrobiales bacterium]
MSSVEESTSFSPKFSADGLLPVITSDAITGDVLMFAYMNEDALKLSLDTGEVHYFSRSRQKIWHKGESSGNTQKIIEMRTDCDQDVLLVRVEQKGGAACHTGRRSCFYRTVGKDGKTLTITDNEKLFDPDEVYKS